MDEKIKAFEEKLQIAINAYLKIKKSLQDGKGIKYCCAYPAANGVALKFSNKLQENILLTFLECTTNARPCLFGYVNLTLKREDAATSSTIRYFFYICTNDYEVLSVTPYKIKVKQITYLYKQDSRLF